MGILHQNGRLCNHWRLGVSEMSLAAHSEQCLQPSRRLGVMSPGLNIYALIEKVPLQNSWKAAGRCY